MTKEELLKPRYKIIADYPGNPFKVGTILVVDEDGELHSVTAGYAPSKYAINISVVSKYQHLVKRLEWWEGRNLEDMPEYVKLNPENTIGGDEVFKVIEVKEYTDGIGLAVEPSLHPESEYIEGKKAHTVAKYFLPSSLEEYLIYKNKNENTISK